MRRPKCPRPEALLEYVSIPDELSLLRRTRLSFHKARCLDCRNQIEKIRNQWQMFLEPEPEITSSLLRVYARLQKDETLILKGWKIGDLRKKPLPMMLVQQGWLFRGAIAAMVFGVMSILVWRELRSDGTREITSASAQLPFAQIRTEDPNRIKVQYLKPELLHSVEFETSNVK